MDNREWGRSEHSGFAWWPFALVFILFLFFWGRHGLWFFAWPMFLVIPFLLFWGVASWFGSAASEAPHERRDENLDDLFFDDPWEKSKRDDSGEKAKRGGDSDIYYV